MLILNPASVKIAGAEHTNVESCAIDRAAHKEVVEWSDNGAFAVFADVPEQRVEIKLTQRLESNAADQQLDLLRPGQSVSLEMVTSLNSSQARRRKLTATGVVRAVRNVVGVGKDPQARRVIELIAISSDGSTDPVGQIDW
jgi:hypothetical protein